MLTFLSKTSVTRLVYLAGLIGTMPPLVVVLDANV